MASDDVRGRYRGLNTDRLVDALRRVRPDLVADPTSTAVLTALKSLARRHRDLTEEIAALTAHLDTLVTAARPALREAYGVGPDVAAQLLITAGNTPERLSSEASFAALCGAAPVPASSGKTHRHRLSRGGNRQPTPPCTASCSTAASTTHPPGPTSPARPNAAAPRARSAGC